MSQARQTIHYRQYRADRWEAVDAEVIVESSVSLTVNGEVWLTFMCTPTDVEALAVGFLYNEGLIESIDELASVRMCASGDNVDVWLRRDIPRPEQWARTSGCTGGLTSVDPRSPLVTLAERVYCAPQDVGILLEQLYQSQELYREARGVHSSALSDGRQLCLLAEDIGRHNTLDKIAGRCLREGIRMHGRILLSTGRISSEMLRKAARMGVPILISRTSPSSMSIELAEKWGVTLIGYARRDRFNVYAHPERISPVASRLQEAPQRPAVVDGKVSRFPSTPDF